MGVVRSAQGDPEHRRVGEVFQRPYHCDYRKAHGTSGPLHMGKDTHALSGPVQRTALEVLAANGVETVIHRGGGWMQSVPPGSSSRSIR